MADGTAGAPGGLWRCCTPCPFLYQSQRASKTPPDQPGRARCSCPLSTTHPTRKPRSQDAENRTCRHCLAVGPCCGNLPALSWAASAPRADVGGKEAPGDTNTAFPSPTARALCSSLTPQPTTGTSCGSYGSKTQCCPYHTTWKINRKNEPCC